FQQEIQEAFTESTRGFCDYHVILEEKELIHLTRATNGDLRSALNGLEFGVKSTPKNEQGEIKITLPIIEECVLRKALT
ncbi:recombinase RarA, partial [Enterococcus faecalis]